MDDIIVVGYPRSGNTYLARLLGNALDSPVCGGFPNVLPLATEGLDRQGKYRVLQLHLHAGAGPGNQFVVTPYFADKNAHKGEKVVVITRDPRDIIVSAKFYWKIESMSSAASSVVMGQHPLNMVGSWKEFVTGWLDYNNLSIVRTSYEALVGGEASDTVYELQRILNLLQVDKDAQKELRTVLYEESPVVKRMQIQKDGDSRPYGKDEQLRHLRNCKVGDWKNHFTLSAAKYVHDHLGMTMLRLGYIDSMADKWYSVMPVERDGKR